MTGIEDAALLAVVAIGSALGASALPRASWPRRCPAAAILLWQALGLASGLAAVGTLIGLALPASQGGLVLSVLRAAGLLRDGELFGLARVFGLSQADGAPLVLVAVRLACLAAGLVLLASLCWVLLAASIAALQARRRQRALLTLLAHGDPKVPGALVVDYPSGPTCGSGTTWSCCRSPRCGAPSPSPPPAPVRSAPWRAWSRCWPTTTR
jgi:hypothetical protein